MASLHPRSARHEPPLQPPPPVPTAGGEDETRPELIRVRRHLRSGRYVRAQRKNSHQSEPAR